MKRIALSKRGPKHKGKYITLVDDDMYEYLNQWSWTVRIDKGRFYAARMITENGKRKHIKMHQVILGIKSSRLIVGDHKNGDGLDNQRHNLRKCTNIQNSYNRKIQAGSSQFKGVAYKKGRNVWGASIRFKKKLKHLGYFKEEVDAAILYNFCAHRRFGEYAHFNTIPNELTPQS